MAYSVTHELLADGNSKVITFSGLASGASSDVFTMYDFPIGQSIYSGTFSGAIVRFKVSNDGVNWEQVDYGVGPATKNILSLNFRYGRFDVTGGDANTSVSTSVRLHRLFSPRI